MSAPVLQKMFRRVVIDVNYALRVVVVAMCYFRLTP